MDARRNMVAVVCGHGKPTYKRIEEALFGHIAPGSTIVRDKGKSHRALVEAVEGVDEACRADTREPAYLKGMQLVNSLCSWIKRYLWRFPGKRPRNLQDHLNWYVYLLRIKRDGERWARLERVARHVVMTEAIHQRSKAG